MLQQNKRDDARLFFKLESSLSFCADAQTAEYITANSRTMSDRTTKITTILKLFYSLFKRDSANEEQTQNTIITVEDEIELSTSIVSPKIEEQESHLETSIVERPEISQKNKWLYPTDNFGKMEHGVVDSEENPKKKKKKARTIYLK